MGKQTTLRHPAESKRASSHSHHSIKVASKLDVIYALSASWGESEAQEDFEMLEKKLTALKPDELILVICNSKVDSKFHCA